MPPPWKNSKSGTKFFGVLKLHGFVYLLMVSLSWGASPEDFWDLSQKSFQSNQPSETCQNLKNWVEIQKTKQVSSAEAFFNLSLCSWQLKEYSRSIIYGLESLKLRNSLFKKWTDIKLLQSFQKEIGIRDNLASRQSFIWRLIFPNQLPIILASLAFWCFLVSIVFFKKLTTFRLTLRGTALMIFGVALLIRSTRYLGGPIAVISETKEVPIVEFDKSGKSNELMLLPPGTMIELGQSKNEFSQVLKPIGGWLKTESLEIVIR